ncbi:MAG: ABC-2 transporter permease [Sporolactobacillus sp.]
MLLSLVKKDFILVKKQLIIIFAFTVYAPLFLIWQSSDMNHALILFMTFFMAEYILFSQISKYEDQYKGAALLCATPYRRSAFVEAKYLFLFLVFIAATLLQLLISVAVNSLLDGINILTLSIIFCVISLTFSIFIPVQFKLGYDKMKFLIYLLIMGLPFSLGPLSRWYLSLDLRFSFPIQLSMPLKALVIFLISLAVSLISLIISLRVYEKKNL